MRLAGYLHGIVRFFMVPSTAASGSERLVRHHPALDCGEPSSRELPALIRSMRAARRRYPRTSSGNDSPLAPSHWRITRADFSCVAGASAARPQREEHCRAITLFEKLLMSRTTAAMPATAWSS